MKSGQQPGVGVIIAAAGESQRMGSIDKVLATLGGEPLLTRTTGPFQKCALVDQIAVPSAGIEYEPLVVCDQLGQSCCCMLS